jgi:hypothetical protein
MFLDRIVVGEFSWRSIESCGGRCIGVLFWDASAQAVLQHSRCLVLVVLSFLDEYGGQALYRIDCQWRVFVSSGACLG